MAQSEHNDFCNLKQLEPLAISAKKFIEDSFDCQIPASEIEKNNVLVNRSKRVNKDGFTIDDDEIILEFAAFYTGSNKWGVITLFVKNKTSE